MREQQRPDIVHARDARYCTKIVSVAELPTAVAVMLLPVICKVPTLVAAIVLTASEVLVALAVTVPLLFCTDEMVADGYSLLKKLSVTVELVLLPTALAVTVVPEITADMLLIMPSTLFPGSTLRTEKFFHEIVSFEASDNIQFSSFVFGISRPRLLQRAGHRQLCIF